MGVREWGQGLMETGSRPLGVGAIWGNVREALIIIIIITATGHEHGCDLGTAIQASDQEFVSCK